MQGHQRALRGAESGVGDVDERSPHDVGERCTSTPHDQHESAQRGHAQQGHEQQGKCAQRKHAEQAHAQQVHATRAWGAQARKTQACTRQHEARASAPRDVDDVDGRRPHDVDERYASTLHDQHEGAQPERETGSVRGKKNATRSGPKNPRCQ